MIESTQNSETRSVGLWLVEETLFANETFVLRRSQVKHLAQVTIMLRSTRREMMLIIEIVNGVLTAVLKQSDVSGKSLHQC